VHEKVICFENYLFYFFDFCHRKVAKASFSGTSFTHIKEDKNTRIKQECVSFFMDVIFSSLYEPRQSIQKRNLFNTILLILFVIPIDIRCTMDLVTCFYVNFT